MKKYLIEDVKVGVSEGGIACGPVSGNVIAEAQIRDMDEGTVKYYSLAEVEGIPNFFETDVSAFDGMISNNPDNEELWDMLSEHSVGEFSDYTGFFDYQDELKSLDEAQLLVWKYLVYIVRANWEEVDRMKTMSVGKCLGDFEIPISDLEQEYLDELEDE